MSSLLSTVPKIIPRLDLISYLVERREEWSKEDGKLSTHLTTVRRIPFNFGKQKYYGEGKSVRYESENTA